MYSQLIEAILVLYCMIVFRFWIIWNIICCRDDREFDFDDEDIDDISEDEGSFGSDMISDISDDDMEGRRTGGRGTTEDDIIEAQTAMVNKLLPSIIYPPKNMIPYIMMEPTILISNIS